MWPTAAPGRTADGSPLCLLQDPPASWQQVRAAWSWHRAAERRRPRWSSAAPASGRSSSTSLHCRSAGKRSVPFATAIRLGCAEVRACESKSMGGGTDASACACFRAAITPLTAAHMPRYPLPDPTGSRPALAAIPPNVAAAANPFSLTVQRQKTAAARTSQQQQHHGATVRFGACAPAGGAVADAENTAVPSAAATPATTVLPTTSGRGAATGGGAPSPSPLVLFRGRLSFAAGEPDSGGWGMGVGRPRGRQCPAHMQGACRH